MHHHLSQPIILTGGRKFAVRNFCVYALSSHNCSMWLQKVRLWWICIAKLSWLLVDNKQHNYQYNTSQPPFKKSAIFVIGTKYAIWGLPVVAVPQYSFKLLSPTMVFNLSIPITSYNKKCMGVNHCSNLW